MCKLIFEAKFVNFILMHTLRGSVCHLIVVKVLKYFIISNASIVLSSITKKGEFESASRLSLVGFGVDEEHN